MSRIGRKVIEVPAGVEVEIRPGRVAVKGPRGALEQSFSPDIEVHQDGTTLTVTRPTDRPDHRALHGLVRTLVSNMVEGVSKGYERRLEIQGVGYRANARGADVEFALGYSHPILYRAPEGVEFEVPTPTAVVVKGIDKQKVGQVSAVIRSIRPPEPYKGKGVRYSGEQISLKEGKKK